MDTPRPGRYPAVGARSCDRPEGAPIDTGSGAADTADRPWRLAPLTPERARDTAACHIACWREAYRGLVPEHLLAAFDLDRRTASWSRIARDPQTSTLVAEAGGEVVGFVHYGPPRAQPAIAERELGALYVRARWYGTGLAHALIRAVLEPDRSCSLWVFERNPRARAFYTKYGFRYDGTSRAERFALATELRMVRPGSKVSEHEH